MAGISTHVLDTSIGRPAAGVSLILARRRQGQKNTPHDWEPIVETLTNQDGRTDTPLLSADQLRVGEYQLTFDVDTYFTQHPHLNPPSFYSTIPIAFRVLDANEHYHIPLLLSPFGFSTYRGS